MRLFSPAFITVAGVPRARPSRRRKPSPPMRPRPSPRMRVHPAGPHLRGDPRCLHQLLRCRARPQGRLGVRSDALLTLGNPRYCYGDNLLGPGIQLARCEDLAREGLERRGRRGCACNPSRSSSWTPLVGVPNPAQEGLRTDDRNQRLDDRPEGLGQADEPGSLSGSDPDRPDNL